MNQNQNDWNTSEVSKTLFKLPFELFSAGAKIPFNLMRTMMDRGEPCPCDTSPPPPNHAPTPPQQPSSLTTPPPSPGGGQPLPPSLPTIPTNPQLHLINQSDLKVDVSGLVVIGDGLSAGMGEFSLHEGTQNWSFPNQLSAQIGQTLDQPLIQAPGLLDPLIDAENSVRPADHYQTTVLANYPVTQTPANLSIPAYRVEEVVNKRCEAPLIQIGDVKQTNANLLAGFHSITLQSEKTSCTPSKTVLDLAIEQEPTMVIISLGFSDLFEATKGKQSKASCPLPHFRKIIAELKKTKAKLILSSVPCPLDTAYFSSLEQAARILNVSVNFLIGTYSLNSEDYLTTEGLLEIGYQIIAEKFIELAPEHRLDHKLAKDVRKRTHELNEGLVDLSKPEKCLLVDLAGFYETLNFSGLQTHSRLLTADYLGGFFSLNGLYPGATGQAAIANLFIHAINQDSGSRIPEVDLNLVAHWDPVSHYAPAVGSQWNLQATSPEPRECPSMPNESSYPIFNEPRVDEHISKPLELPEGLEQVIPLTEALSYHGDGMRIVNTKDPKAVFYGGTGNLCFDGLALFGSHLKGSLRIKFSPPKGTFTKFTVEIIDGVLPAQNGILATPEFYRFPLHDCRVTQPPNMLASGVLDLMTGSVDPTTLKLFCMFENTGLAALARLNPHNFPSPAIITFSNEEGNPKVYGSSWAQFRQREDGMLDFVFHGTSFVPLGPGSVYPLPLGSADGKYPVVPTSGTALHPNLHLSTVSPAGERTSKSPCIPESSVQELDLCTARSSFGDYFRLNNPVLGDGLGRSFLAGRLRIQFGKRFADSIPFSVTFLPPSGLLENTSYEPIQSIFPSPLTRGFLGHDGIVHYPLRSYNLNNTWLVEDPLDLALGAVNVHSGKVIGNFLHRGLIGQDLIFALFRVEPRTPKASFQFRGEASFSRDPDDNLRYHLDSAVYIPYPEGFLFPLPDLAEGTPIGSNSSLDPYLQIEAVSAVTQEAMLSGAEHRVTAATNTVFSYNYSLSESPHHNGESRFEFVNHSDQDAKFELKKLAALSFSKATANQPGAKPDVVSFTGIGTWSKDPGTDHFITVSISRAPEYRYVSIQIDGGSVITLDPRPAITPPPLEPVHATLP